MEKKLLIIDENFIDSLWLDALKEAFEVDIVQSVLAFENLLKFNKLSDYPVVLIDPGMDPTPTYSMNLSADGIKTGYLLYEDFLKDSDCFIFVWSKELLDMYEELNWGKNSSFQSKNISPNKLISLIDEIYL